MGNFALILIFSKQNIASLVGGYYGMKNIQTIFSILFCFLVTTANAQTKSFELHNADAMLLDSGTVGMLSAGYWRVYKDDVGSRGQTMSTPKNTSLCYYPDGTFFYNGARHVENTGQPIHRPYVR